MARATAGSVSIQSIPDGVSGQSVDLSVDITKGNALYDFVECVWTADDGTIVDTTSARVITFWARGATAPTAPTDVTTWNYNGNATWTRGGSQPSATTLLNVYKAIRIEHFDGTSPSATTFVSAEWGAGVVKVADVLPPPPTTVRASAGSDVTINDDTDPNTYTLRGSATVANAVGATAYQWTFVGGATQSGYTASLGNPRVAQPILTLPNLPDATTRTWTLRLTATNNGVSDSDDVVITLADTTPAPTPSPPTPTPTPTPTTPGPTPTPTPTPTPGNQAPGPPRSPSGTADTTDAEFDGWNYTVRWSAPSTGGTPTLYRVQFLASGNRVVATRTTASTSLRWLSSQSDRYTSFQVRAENAHGESSYVRGSI